MGSALVLPDVLTGHVPGRDGFHSVPLIPRKDGDRVESIPTESERRFMESLLSPLRMTWDHQSERDAFHRVPISSGEFRDAVECVPSALGSERAQEGASPSVAELPARN